MEAEMVAVGSWVCRALCCGTRVWARGLGEAGNQHLQIPLQPCPVAFGAHLCCLEKILLYQCSIVT